MAAAERFYSQLGQDRFIYEKYFQLRAHHGIFVDVGASDGVTISNTLFFEETLGWTGLCIEPLPSEFEKLKARRKVPCLNCAVADTNGTADFLEIELGDAEKAHSGLKASYDLRHLISVRANNAIIREIKVEARRLGDILSEHGLQTIDYISIDTEGSEWKIVRDLDFKRYDIRAMSVENNYQNEQLRQYLAAAGYTLVQIFGGYDDLYIKRSLLAGSR
ncbi:MAG TPA: FkbM family methyltransferase [Stellaceae bacterium]|jgi:FkbM family methyltransferase|nr:FkbM family methyltransferase [Stellaceae bacterium]